MENRPATIPGYLLDRAARSPAAIAYRRRDAAGWHGESWESVLERVRRLSGHLIRLGLAPGDRVAIMMPSSITWELCHLAALAAGCAVVGVDAHDSPENVRHILRTVAPRGLVVATAGQRESLLEFAPDAAAVTLVDGPTAGGAGYSLPELLGSPCPVPDTWPLATPEHLATIIFTSGSTGRPKGVAYSHAQLCLACEGILERFPSIGEGARFACWLPLSNLFQRIINLCGMIRGGESYFVGAPTEIIERLPEIRPSIFIGVPRFYEKLHAGIEAKLAALPAWVRVAIRGARRIATAYRSAQRSDRLPGMALGSAFRLADRLFLRRIRSLMGPDLQFMVSGSAPLPAWLMESFHAIGWLVLEAYGTSENVVPIAINAPDAYRFGSVGRPLPQNEVRLAEDGELLVRGAGVCTGYYGDGGAGSPVDADGFLHTGDFARLDAEGFLWLTGRKSEIFKTSTGRRVAPVPIEAHLKQLPYVDYAVVVGRERPLPVALLCLNPSALGAAGGGDGPLGAEVLDRIATDMAAACAGLPPHDRPAGAIVSRTAWTIMSGELTSNLKLRRGTIETRYRAELDALYTALGARRSAAQPLIREAP